MTSPGYPDNYGPNLDCNYRLVGAGRNDYLTIDFDAGQFEMEQADCKYDYLLITDAVTGAKVLYLYPSLLLRYGHYQVLK